MWFCSSTPTTSTTPSSAPPTSSAAASLGCRGVRTDGVEGPRAFSGVHDDKRIAFYALFAAACSFGVSPFQSSRRHTWAKTSICQTQPPSTPPPKLARLRSSSSRRAPRSRCACSCGTSSTTCRRAGFGAARASCCSRSLGHARRANATAQLWVNAMADDPLWHRAVDGWRLRRHHIDAVGIDHYPGTWTLSSWTDWAPLDRLLDATATSGAAWPRGGRPRDGLLVVVVDRRVGGHACLVGQRVAAGDARACARPAPPRASRWRISTRCSTACTRRPAGGGAFWRAPTRDARAQAGV